MTLNAGLDLSLSNMWTGKEYGTKQGEIIQEVTRLPDEFTVSVT
jgi:hypothetical protein